MKMILAFIHIQWHAWRTAIILDDCVRALGQMSHSKYLNNDEMIMKASVRQELIHRACFQALPQRKWR